MQFTDEEENRIYYMDIFNAYTSTIEDFVLAKLRAHVSDHNITGFLHELKYLH